LNRQYRMMAAAMCAVLLCGTLLAGCGETETTQEKAALTVSTSKAEMTGLAELMSYSGTARGQEEAVVMPEITGKVTSVEVEPGDFVEAGQVLITLESATYDAGVAQASAGVNQAVAGVTSAMSQVLSAQAGVDQAQAAKVVNDIAVEQARLNYERVQTLFTAGAASQAQLDAAKAAYDQAAAGVPEAAVAAAEAGVNAAMSGVDASQAAVGVAEAGLQAAQAQADKCLIKAPIRGVVGNLTLTVGNTASPAVSAAIVSDLDKMEIIIEVGESEISYMQTGSEVEVLVRAAREEPFAGYVTSVSPVSDPGKKTFKVKIEVNNPDHMIKSGMFTEVKAKTISKKNVLCIPLSAVVPRGARSVVYVLDENNRAHEKEITTGISNDVLIEVTSGLEDGDVIVTKGNTLLSEGTLVRVGSQEAQ